MRQGIAVGLFGGAIVGFIVALFSGVLGLSQIEKAPDWLQGWSGTLGVLVSVYAVYLVGQTLKATQDALKVTQDTLDATREMAKDQFSIGDAQTRPWVLVDDFSNSSVKDGNLVVFSVSNLGNLPALNIEVITDIIYSRFDDFIDVEDSHPTYFNAEKGPFEYRYVLPVGKRISLSPTKIAKVPSNIRCQFYVSLTYKSPYDTKVRQTVTAYDINGKFGSKVITHDHH